MPYTADISRANPALFLFLVVQCFGVAAPMPGQPEVSKRVVAADAVNRIVDTLCQRCSVGMDVRDYFHIGILGFTTRGKLTMGGKPVVTSHIAGATPEQPFLPISKVVDVAGIEKRRVKENYGGGEIVEVTRRMPVWLRPERGFLSGGWGPLRGTLEFVKRPVVEWIALHSNSYPPTVILICDGYFTDGDPEPVTADIKNLSTNDGNVLFFTVHLSASETSPLQFPSWEEDVPKLHDGDSRQLFRLASVLPEGSRRSAASLGFTVDENSRGFILNADAVSLAQFMDIGTRGPSNLH